MSACFRSITAALIAVAIFTPGPVLAQDDMADRLLVCDGIDDPAERMACFNEVVDGLRETPPVEAPPAAPAEESPPVAPVAAPAATSTVEAEPVAVPEVDAAATIGGATAEPQPEEADTAITEINAADSEPVDDIERMHAEMEAGGEINATIVSVRQSEADYRYYIELDNGQLWRETEGSRVREPKPGWSVRITRGRLGSYYMKFNNDNRRAAVRRIR